MNSKKLGLGALCLLLLALALSSPVHGQASGQPSIRILAPLDNQIVPIGDVTVRVEAANFPLGGSNAWQLYVDGKSVGRAGDGATSLTTPILVSGPHELRASLANGQTDNLASASINVTAAPATPTQSPFNLSWTIPVMAVLVLFVLGLIAFGLRLTRRPAGS